MEKHGSNGNIAYIDGHAEPEAGKGLYDKGFDIYFDKGGSTHNITQ